MCCWFLGSVLRAILCLFKYNLTLDLHFFKKINSSRISFYWIHSLDSGLSSLDINSDLQPQIPESYVPM